MNVRSAITAMLALAAAMAASLAAVPPPALASVPQPRVTVAVVPAGTEATELVDAVPGMAPGLMGGGLGDVSAGQSYLDMTQGGRLAQSLYPRALPPIYVTGDRVPERIWRRIRSRAQRAPAEIVPGLLESTLERAGVSVAAQPATGSAAIIAADRAGRIDRAKGCRPSACPGLTVTTVDLEGLTRLGARIDPDGADLLIAIASPPTGGELLSAGILGSGFGGGNLTSATTRLDGYVLATDLAPTILDRFGLDVPSEVSGRPITVTGGSADAAGVVALGQRLGEVGDRRSAVLGLNLIIWVALVLAGAALGGRRAAGVGLAALAVSMAIEPALLLATAGLAPSLLAEQLIIGIGAPAFALLSILVARAIFGRRGPFAAFALAAAITMAATGVDMILGSPLTARSLIGPNPALGVRFYGIGNELEAIIGVLLVLGAGSAVSALQPVDPGRRMAAVTAGTTVVAVLLFAPGRLGADVGAAITFPAGAAGAIIVALHVGRRRALLLLAAPLVAVAALIGIDLLTGGDSHLSRSVLGAGSLGDLGDVVQRRAGQTLRSFPRLLSSPFFIAALFGLAAGAAYRRTVLDWLAAYPAALAGVAGAGAAAVAGTLGNDSGALILMIATGYTAAFIALVWASAADGSFVPGGRSTTLAPYICASLSSVLTRGRMRGESTGMSRRSPSS